MAYIDIDWYLHVPFERFEKMHTRELLICFNAVRKITDGVVRIYGVQDGEDYLVTLRYKLKRLLDTREHIPNKQQGKIIRRLKAQGRYIIN